MEDNIKELTSDENLKQLCGELLASGKWSPSQYGEAISKLSLQEVGNQSAPQNSRKLKGSEIDSARERLMYTQSDYKHCDFTDSSGHKCGHDANNFLGGLHGGNKGKYNSVMLCDEHKYISGRHSFLIGLFASMGIAIIGAIILKILEGMNILPFSPGLVLILYGGSWMIFILKGYVGH